MQTAGDLVDLTAELTAGVQHGHHRLQRRLAGAGVRIDWDAPAVVAHGDAAVLVDVDPDVVAVAGHRLVDAVVGDLEDEVVQTTLVGAADVHTGAAAYGLQAFEDLNITGCVLFFGSFRHGSAQPSLGEGRGANNLGFQDSVVLGKRTFGGDEMP